MMQIVNSGLQEHIPSTNHSSRMTFCTTSRLRTCLYFIPRTLHNLRVLSCSGGMMRIFCSCCFATCLHFTFWVLASVKGEYCPILSSGHRIMHCGSGARLLYAVSNTIKEVTPDLMEVRGSGDFLHLSHYLLGGSQ